MTKLNEGEMLEIDNKIGTICFEDNIDGYNYICIAFENEDKVSFEIYEYKYEEDKLLVGNVEDEEEMKEVLKTFIKNNSEEIILPKELEEKYIEFIKKVLE